MDKPKNNDEVAAAPSASDISSVPPEAAPTISSAGIGEEVFFLARKELDFGANHAHTALLLADIDGDGQQELIVGSLDGKLAVYKGLERSEPWALATGLGMLRVFATGRVWPWLKAKIQPPQASEMMFSSTTASTEEEARESEAEEVDECSREQPPQLIAVTVEGDLYVFDFRNAPSSSLSSPSSTIHSVTVSEQHASQPNMKDNKNLPSPSPAQQPPPWKLAPSQTLSVEPNVMAALVVDVDGDGHQELLLGRMDGVVQAFGWRLQPLPPSPGDAEQDGEEEKEEEEEEKNQQNYQYLEPELYKKGTGQVSSSVVSLSTVRCEGPEGSSLCVVAGLDTGTVEVLRCYSSGKVDDNAPLSSLVDLGVGGGLPLPHCGWSGPLTCSSLREGGGRGGFAVAGLDGRLAMGIVEQQHERQEQQLLGSDEDLVWQTVWSLQTTQPFYAVVPFRISRTDFGKSGFAACAWSGLTCLVNASDTLASSDGVSPVDIAVFDPSKMLVPPLRGFVAGCFGEHNEPCLLYSCADGKILVFHDLERQLLQFRGVSPESEDEAAAAARQLRSEEAQKLVKAWIELYVESTTDDGGTETKEGTSAKNKRINVDKGPPTGAVPTKGK
jgi:hypothetical protein